jgi:hypothetical protein
MKKELLDLDISLEKLSLNSILIDSFENTNDNVKHIYLSQNSLIKTNQYSVREFYKLNTTIILNHG